ncbi:MAG TPA: PBP1A family penicillin-binding protein, partial [Vicinamibacterales bacterium]
MNLRPEWLRSLRLGLRNRPRLLAATILILAAALLASTAWAVWFAHDLTAGLPDDAAIRGLGVMPQATTIYDASDQPAFTLYTEERIEVPLEHVSKNLINAVLSVEDQRFYDHAGVDFIRIGAAFLHNLEAGRRAEGASTITQQLARQSFLSPDKTLRRKLKEVILAARIEREYSKHDILELYLNKVYLGDGYYGVEAASRGYFGKHAGDLTVDEAALLAGLIQSPSSYAPTSNLDRAIARRTVVLERMLAAGVIDRTAYDRCRHAAVHLVNGLGVHDQFGLYFKEEVRKELVDRFGWTRVGAGGLNVYTTIDQSMQREAEHAVNDGVEAVIHRKEKHRKGQTQAEHDDPLQGALVALDPATGEIRALVGGRDFTESPFDRAIQAKRQAGSAFKPFVYAAALEDGYTPATLITNLDTPIATPEGDWTPEDEHVDSDSLTLRTALRISSNRAAVQVLSAIGIPRAVSYAERLDVGTPPSVPSLALGASDVSLLSLTAAYGAFDDQGIVRTPVFIRRVDDNDGKVLYENPGASHRAITANTAFLMSSMLADVVNAGTGYKARQAGFTLPAAGKTGTTNDYMDAWFVGYTPHLVTGVWVGYDQPKTIIANGYAADVAVPIWAAFMKTATKGDKPEWFKKPDDIIAVNVCRLSGKLPNAGCSHVQVVQPDGMIATRSMIYTEYFVKGTEPTTECPLHPWGSAIDALTGTAQPIPAAAADVPPGPPAGPAVGVAV